MLWHKYYIGMLRAGYISINHSLLLLGSLHALSSAAHTNPVMFLCHNHKLVYHLFKTLQSG